MLVLFTEKVLNTVIALGHPTMQDNLMEFILGGGGGWGDKTLRICLIA